MSETSVNYGNPLQSHDDEVDLTNLADPLLVLCAMLILTWQSLSVVASDLAETHGDKADPASSSPVAISFTENGKLYWNQEPIEMEQIGKRLKDLKQADPETTVYLAGERNAKYETSLLIKAQFAEHGWKIKELVRQPNKE